MEETGIIRRLDALGRIVIPREFRKLHRIEVGDPLEMRTNANGEITIRKVDVSAQLKSVGALAISALTPHTDKQIAVCSCEEWLLFSGGKSIKQPELPEALQTAVQSRKHSVLACAEAGVQSRFAHVAVYPVAGETGVFGALVLFTDPAPAAAENTLFATMAAFMGASVQKF